MPKEAVSTARFEPELRNYDAFLREKVELARASMRAGLGDGDEDVEAEFAVRRRAVTGGPFA